MPLGQVTAKNNNRCGEHLAGQRPPQENFYKNLQQGVIHKHEEYKQHQVADQLLPAAHFAIVPNHVFAQQKAQRESDHIRNKQGGDVRFHGVKTQVKVFFLHHIMQGKVKDHKTQNSIDPATSDVIIALLVHKTLHQRVKKVQDPDDEISGFFHALQK